MNSTIIKIMSMILFISAISLFFIGFHNIDLAMNLVEHDIIEVDIGMLGENNMTYVDLYLNGLQAILISTSFFIIAFICEIFNR